MPYRKIDPKLWDDEKIAQLDATTKLVWIYVLTGTHTTSLPGLWIVGPASMAEGLRLPVDTVIACLKTLRSLGVIDWDERARLLRVRNAPRHNKADNHRVVNAWFSKWRDLPECQLKYDHVESLRDGVFGNKPEEVWACTFGEIVPPESFANRSRIVPNYSDTVPNCSPALRSDPDLISQRSGSLSSKSGSSDAGVRVAGAVPETEQLRVENQAQSQPAQQPLIALEPCARGKSPSRKRTERQSVAPSLQGYAQAYADGQVDAGAETFARDLSSRAEVAYRRILTDHAGSPRGDEARAALRRFSADYRRAIPGSKVDYQNGFAPWRCLEWLNSRGARNATSTLQPGHGGNVGTYVNLDDYAESAQ